LAKGRQRKLGLSVGRRFAVDSPVPLWPVESSQRVQWRSPLLSPQSALHRIADELAVTYAGVFSPETVERYVCESFSLLSDRARIRTHLVSMTKRFARDRLRALGQTQGLLSRSAPEVLFVCGHNAGRSQMAAALLRRRGADRILVRSAGSVPAAELELAVVEVMAEIGLDLSSDFPKPLTDEAVRAADVVITMGCGDACALYAGKMYLDWDLPDPAGTRLPTVRAIRDEIDRRVGALVPEILPAAAGT
jgi:arsenate reductase (thioredoxin)